MIPKAGVMAALIYFWRSQTEAADTFLTAAAIQTVALAAGPGAYFIDGYRRIYLNTWAVLVGPSTRSRKSTTLKLPGYILDRAGLGSCTVPSSTFEGIYQLFADQTDKKTGDIIEGMRFGVQIHDELENFRKALERPHLEGLAGTLLGFYDGGKVTTHSLTRGVTVADVRGFSMFAGTTPRRLLFTEDDTTSGFMARFTFWASNGNSGRIYPTAPLPDERALTELSQAVGSLRLQAGPTQFDRPSLDRFTEWYTQQKSVTPPEAIAANYDRHDGLVKKLASISALSNYRRQITLPDLEWALGIIDYQRDILAKLTFTEDKSPFGKNRQKVLSHLTNHNGSATRRELMRSAHVKLKDFEEVIETLLEEGIVTTSTIQNINGEITLCYLLTDTDF